MRILGLGCLFLLVLFVGCKNREQRESEERKAALLTRFNQLVDLDPVGYREASWGMTVEQVGEVLKQRKDSKASNLIDLSMMAGKGTYAAFDLIVDVPSTVLYLFSDKGLIAVTVYYDQDMMHVSNSTVSDFNQLESMLIGKYGEPLGRTRTGTSSSLGIGDGEFSDFWPFYKTQPVTDQMLTALDMNDINTTVTIRLGKSTDRFLDGITLTIKYVCPQLAAASVDNSAQPVNPF